MDKNIQQKECYIKSFFFIESLTKNCINMDFIRKVKARGGLT